MKKRKQRKNPEHGPLLRTKEHLFTIIIIILKKNQKKRTILSDEQPAQFLK